jgi:hypothetical protein
MPDFSKNLNLDEASELLKNKIKAELERPQYKGLDPDTAETVALEAIYKAEGPEIFEPSNAVDSILLLTFTGVI